MYFLYCNKFRAMLLIYTEPSFFFSSSDKNSISIDSTMYRRCTSKRVDDTKRRCGWWCGGL